MNELLNGGNVSKKNTEVDKLITNTDAGVDRIVTTETDIAESFNDFFWVNIGPKLAEAIPAGSGNHMNYLSLKNEKSLFWAPVTCREICNYFHTLDKR